MFEYFNDIEEITDIFLDLYKQIIEKFHFINKNEKILLIDNSLRGVDLLMDSINKLAEMLEANPLFEDEFFLLISIIPYFDYIIENNILKEHLSFIGNNIINFSKLICNKQNQIIANKIYENQYNDVLEFFINKKKQFSQSLPKDYKYNDLIDEVTNILW